MTSEAVRWWCFCLQPTMLEQERFLAASVISIFLHVTIALYQLGGEGVRFFYQDLQFLRHQLSLLGYSYSCGYSSWK